MTSSHANLLKRLNFDTSVILRAALNSKTAYLKLKRSTMQYDPTLLFNLPMNVSLEKHLS